MVQSSILYSNTANTLFLIDIPTSIALAQELSPSQQGQPISACVSDPREKRHRPPSLQARNHARPTLLSSAPLTEPYSASTEPKTEAARARVLARIPASERVFQTETIEPLIRTALAELKRDLPASQEWCVARVVQAQEAPLALGPKRKRGATQHDARAALAIPTDECGCFADRDGSVTVALRVPSVPVPMILSSGPHVNVFASMSELCNTTLRNPAAEQALLDIRCTADAESARPGHPIRHVYLVPPVCSFVLCTLPLVPVQQQQQQRGRGRRQTQQTDGPIPGLPPSRKFNLILLDPPWSNRSVRRSGHYEIQSHQGMDLLGDSLGAILQTHLQDSSVTAPSLAAIWITNAAKARKAAYDALGAAGLAVCEEWVWVKTTTRGEPITPVDGVWRKPYEILVVGRKDRSQCKEGDAVVRRVVAAVPDVHSRKPNLREVFERVFFAQAPVAGLMVDAGLSYSALEVFARNLTAGWWACGNEVLKFNSREWWELP